MNNELKILNIEISFLAELINIKCLIPCKMDTENGKVTRRYEYEGQWLKRSIISAYFYRNVQLRK